MPGPNGSGGDEGPTVDSPGPGPIAAEPIAAEPIAAEPIAAEDGAGSRAVLTRTFDAALDERRESARAAARLRARRSWRRYGAGLAVVLTALLVFMFSAWRTSEIRAVRSHPTATSAKGLRAGPLPSSLRSLWKTTDQLALGQPVYLDVVATYSRHMVVGRDASTGAVRWSYRRSDRTICSVVGDGNIVLAFYRHDGNCDELTGLDAESGKRVWTRTQFENGTPTFQPISQTLLQITPGSVELIQPSGGAIYWYYPQVANCTTISGVVGTTGALWGTRCASGSTLSLRYGCCGDRTKNNAWSVPLDGRTPLSADDGSIMVLSSDHRSIQVLAAKDGRVSTTITLPDAITPPSAPSAVSNAAGTIQLITVPGQLLAIVADNPTAVLWQHPSPGTPAVTGRGLYFPNNGRVDVVDDSTGKTQRQVAAPGMDAGARLAPRGVGLVAGTAAGTSAWG